MQRELFILRHAKSDWSDAAQSDFDRPLNRRGEKDARTMGEWMREHYLYPAIILASPALRARQTVVGIGRALEIPDEKIRFDERLYLAPLQTLLKILAGVPIEYNSVMLVGHNPGLDELVSYISADNVPLSDSGKLMTTAALAHFKLPAAWDELRESAQLVNMIRPREIA